MITESSHFRLLRDETQEMMRWQRHIQETATTEFDAAQQIVRRLGAHWKNDRAEIGFWVPELVELEIPPERVMLDLFTPLDDIDFDEPVQKIRFQRDRLQLMREGNYMWGVVEGMTPGSRDELGTLYQLVYQARSGDWVAIHDHLAYSIPWGAFAPAEFYDMEGMFAQRGDKDHFQRLHTEPDPDGVPRVQEPTNILQIHAGYASEAATLAGLTRMYQDIGRKIEAGEELHPAEQNYLGYDAIQLMPVEPIIEYEAGPKFWEAEDRPFADELQVTLRQPDMTNWGYDVVISASSATNPVLLESKRPDELLDLIETLHNFPGQPIGVMFDIVYGHLDNQALALLNKEFFAGANMYGQNVNFLNPVVRAILLEMMRRKHNYGVDGIRVDGAQDFKWWDPETDTMHHDDDFLHKMNDVELDVAGVHYRPWMIFEDGRPWPRDDWELASTYREVTKRMPNVWQWGPLTFAHNTPFLFTFWLSKWWRIREMADIGREWITGCSNHDTLRRGTQVPLDSRINTYLGDTLPEIIRNAYDNPASKLFDYAMMPGIPMDFLNATMRTPWGFVRNTDDRYGVKVVSEEALWTYWRMSPESYNRPEVFHRMKELGFTDLDGLRRFLRTLDHAVKATDYYLDAMVRLMQNMYPPLAGPKLSVQTLKDIARAFMDDVHDYCNVSLYWHLQDGDRTQFNRDVREFRRERPWLIDNLTEREALSYRHPSDGTALFYGLRVSPDNKEQVLFVANMEGAAATVTPNQLDLPNLRKTGWDAVLITPGLDADSIRADKDITLEDSQGVIFTRIRGE
jgi:hypothetical protein